MTLTAPAAPPVPAARARASRRGPAATSASSARRSVTGAAASGRPSSRSRTCRAASPPRCSLQPGGSKPAPQQQIGRRIAARRRTVRSSSAQTASGTSRPRPSARASPSRPLLRRARRPWLAIQSAGAVPASSGRTDGPGARRPAAAARAADGHARIVGQRAPGRQRQARPAPPGRCRSAPARSSGSSSGSSGTGARSAKRAPATAARARPARVGTGAARRALQQVEAELDRRRVARQGGADDAGLGPGRIGRRLRLGGGAGRLDLAGGEPRLQPARLDLRTLRPSGTRARSCSAAAGSAMASRRSSAQQEQSVAARRRSAWAPRAGLAAARPASAR